MRTESKTGWLRQARLAHGAALAGALCVAVSAVVLAQGRDFSAVEIKAHQVSDTISMLEGAGGNIGVWAGDDGVFLIDDQFAPLTDKILAAIARISDREVRFLINTHIHPDHVGGNENLGKRGVTIVGHENIRARLMEGVFNNPPAPPVALPVITFEDSITFHLNGEDARAFKVPNSHTDGDTIVHFQGSDVLHTGDVFRTTSYPVIDIRHGGTYKGTVEALDIILEVAGPDTKIIPGHGVVTDEAMVQTFRDMVATIGDRIAALVAESKTVEEVWAAKVTADFDERWSYPEGFFFTNDQFIEIVYNELKGGQ